MPFLSVGPAESLASAMSASVKAAHPYARSTWRTIQHLGTNTRSSCSGIPVPAWAFLDCRRNGQARLSEVGDVRFAPKAALGAPDYASSPISQTTIGP